MAIITVFGIDMALGYVAPISYDIGDDIVVGEDCTLWEDIANYSYAVITCNEWDYPIEWYTMEDGSWIKTAMRVNAMPQSASAVYFELEETARASYL